MNVYLLYKNRDFNLSQNLPWNEQEIIQDIELNTLFNAMAKEDKFLFEVAKSAVLSGLGNDIDTILYRQSILKDCIKNPSVIREIYALATEAIERERKNYWGIFNKHPGGILRRSLDVMQMFLIILKSLRNIAEKSHDKFSSEGFIRFFTMLEKEFEDEYFTEIQSHIEQLKFRNGILVSARLSSGNKISDYILHPLRTKIQGWFMRFLDDYIHLQNQEGKLLWIARFFNEEPGSYTFYISSRDDSGIRALSQLKDEGINSVTNSLTQSNDHILGFFQMLKTELGYYIAALNLYEQLTALNEPVSFPEPVDNNQHKYSFIELYDACLALTLKGKVVGNDIDANGKNLVIITGANQGGKSTFLRSIGLSQIMMQSGLFVPAESFCANICDSLFTHFKREEDISMKSGKLDEELNRMNNIINNNTPNPMFLFNESFAATNEREGSEIARQIVSALLEKKVKIFYVTHLYEFANSFYSGRTDNFLFLRAERNSDATRTFKLNEGKPLQTSHAEDLYNKVFGNE